MSKAVLSIIPLIVLQGYLQLPEVPSPSKESMDHGSINNYVFWAVTATVTGILLYIVTRFIPWLISEFGKALKEETEACRLERENAGKAHADEREIDRQSRHDVVTRMQSAIADVCTEFRNNLKDLRQENSDRTARLEDALNRQTDSITGALRSQTEVIVNKNGGKKTRAQLELQQSPNNLDQPPTGKPNTPCPKPES